MINIDHLNKTINRHEVLCDVSMRISPGTIAGISGPNGSGKTMLMRAAVGLVRPTSGTITVNGCNPWIHTSKLSRASNATDCVGQKTSGVACHPGKWPTIGLLLEGPAFLDNCTGYENLKILADVRGLPSKDAILAALESVGLNPNDRRRYRAYSLGMRQRLGIAGAILGSPEVLVLDEPTNALDDSGVELIISLIKQAIKQGTTVMLTCHDSDVLRELSHEIWYMAEGRITHHEALKEIPEPVHVKS